MPKQYHAKLITKRTTKGEEFHLDFKDELGKRRFRKAHSGVCQCEQSARQRANRPCEHYSAALKALADFKARTGQGEGERDSDWQTFKVRYEEHLESSDKAPGTIESYKHSLKLFSDYCASKGIRLMSQINRAHIDAWAGELKQAKSKNAKKSAGKDGAGIKNATVNLHLRNLRTALNCAVQWGMAKSNPVSARSSEGASPFRRTSDSKRINYLDKPEIQTLLQGTEGAVRDMLVIFLNCGLRLGELQNLRWENWTGEALHIHSREEWRPKSQHGNRLIPLTAAAKAVFKRRAAERSSDYVFPSPDGGKLTKRTIQGYFERRYRDFGIKGKVLDAPVNIHTLRHTFATSMLYLGTPLVVVKDLMGHADISTTMRYVHLMPKESERFIQKLTFEQSEAPAPALQDAHSDEGK